MVGFPLAACSGSLFSEAIRVCHREGRDAEPDRLLERPLFIFPFLLMIARGQTSGLHLIIMEL